MNDALLSKIRKLLALSQSSNEHEAALAASKAQALMLEHKIEAADLNVSEQTSAVVEEAYVTEDMGKFTYMAWKGSLVTGMAYLNSCKTIRYPGNRLKIIGRREDRQVVEYLACFLIREIERLAFDSYRAAGFHGNGQRWIWVQNFGMGAVGVILRRMRDEKDRIVNASNRCMALVLRDDKAVESYMSQKYPNIRYPRCSYKTDGEAKQAGLRAGATITWHSAMNAAPAARRIA